MRTRFEKLFREALKAIYNHGQASTQMGRAWDRGCTAMARSLLEGKSVDVNSDELFPSEFRAGQEAAKLLYDEFRSQDEDYIKRQIKLGWMGIRAG